MLFVASTTGDGDPPDTAIKFWRSLKKSKENLENMSYALLGMSSASQGLGKLIIVGCIGL